MTSIEWSDEVWNFLVGCSRVSAGCDHCYAMGMAHRGMSAAHKGLTKLRPRSAQRPGVDWNGKVRTLPGALDKPLHWRKPRRVFVNSMSDLFHSKVPFPFIAAAFGVMAACPQHTFQVLTKRPRRMLEFFAWVRSQPRLYASETDAAIVVRAFESEYDLTPGARDVWPLPNVHLGVSVENQETADERMPLLLQAPAAIRWVSYEPALDQVDFTRWIDDNPRHLDWIVVGGESGGRARSFDVGWARSVIEQCEDTNCHVFVKQFGAKPFAWRETPRSVRERVFLELMDAKGGDMAEWDADLRVRQAPPCTNSPAWDAAMRRAA